MDSKQKIKKQLRIIQGQVAGLERMVDKEDASCREVITQLKAIMSSMKSVGNKIAHEGIETCIREESKEDQEKMIQDILKLFSSL